eukprot:4257140-Prymnesium_polylepis.1
MSLPAPSGRTRTDAAVPPALLQVDSPARAKIGLGETPARARPAADGLSSDDLSLLRPEHPRRVENRRSAGSEGVAGR